MNDSRNVQFVAVSMAMPGNQGRPMLLGLGVRRAGVRFSRLAWHAPGDEPWKKPLVLSLADALALAPLLESRPAVFLRVDAGGGPKGAKGDGVAGGIDALAVQLAVGEHVNYLELLAVARGEDMADWWTKHELSPVMKEWIAGMGWQVDKWQQHVSGCLAQSMNTTNTTQAFLPCADKRLLRQVLAPALAALPAAVWRAALAASTKDGVAAFAHADFALQFVAQAQGVQDVNGVHEFTHAGGVHAAIQLPAGVTQANGHDGAATTVRAGLAFEGGKYLLVVGAWACALDELALHGVSCDTVAQLTYAAKYAHKHFQQRSE